MGRPADRPLEELERELRIRAFERDAELIVSTDPDGRCRVAFMKSVNPIGPHGVVLLQTAAVHKRLALQSLLTVDAVRPPH
jgi:hypothetical protein